MKIIYFVILSLSISLLAAVDRVKKHNTRSLAMETPQFRVVKRYERKGDLFYTQGLLFKDSNTLIESAGLYGESALHFVHLNDNLDIKDSVKLTNEFFAEGCTMIKTNNGDKEIYQLTWRERKIFVYDGDTLALKKTLELPRPIGEGWGLTHRLEDGKYKLYISDGSNKVFVVDPETMAVERTIEVKDNEVGVNYLNELEFVGDVLLSNVYLTSKIVAIDIKTGKVTRNIDCSDLVNEVQNSQVFKDNNFNYSECLNGIAYHPGTDTLLITGKKWPYIYQIELKQSL